MPERKTSVKDKADFSEYKEIEKINNNYGQEIYLCYYNYGNLKTPYCDIIINSQIIETKNCNKLSFVGACNRELLEKIALEIAEELFKK